MSTAPKIDNANKTKVFRKFDFSKFKQRHVALKIVYFGWELDGLSAQIGSEKTVEHHLFQALTKTCLIESRDKCNYNRCGRTDKGVSSYGQVININIRSCLVDEDNPVNVGLFTPEPYSKPTDYRPPVTELNYVDMLNRVLPDEVKVIAWAPLRSGFSARFNCKSRSYSYIFPIGDLCIKSMEKSLHYLVGEHDFRNLCSFDLKNGVTNHKRKIISVRLEPVKTIGNSIQDCSSEPSCQYSFYQMIIVGQAFLYHQIRCIMSIIFLIGNRKESPEVLRDLLDINKCPSKPNYNPAAALPLCLFDCKYDESDLPLGWNCNQQSLKNLVQQIKSLWWRYKTKTLLIERVLMDLDIKSSNGEEDGPSIEKKIKFGEPTRWRDFGLSCDTMSDSKYIPLLDRPRDETLEHKLESLKNKQAKTSGD